MQAMHFRVCLAAVAVAAAAGGCAEPAPEPGVEVAYYTAPGDEDPCPPDGCGGNSPVVGGVYFWQLHIGSLPGVANEGGVRITSITNANGMALRFRLADGDRLLGVDPMTGAVISQGTTLLGTRIALDVNGMPYELLIDAAAPSESFWVGDPLPIWLYSFRYRPLPSEQDPDRPVRWRALCSEGDGDPTLVHAMVFGGDRYDPVTKKITVGPETRGWMNIACAKSAIYKMHKIGHTTAAQSRLGLVTTVAQRRAMLNAWTSNVCGTGEAFTRQGEPITLRDALGWFGKAPYNGVAVSPEAIWDEDGAVCLDVHRLHEDDAAIYDKMRAACGGSLPPSCAELAGSWTTHGHVRTGNL